MFPVHNIVVFKLMLHKLLMDIYEMHTHMTQWYIYDLHNDQIFVS